MFKFNRGVLIIELMEIKIVVVHAPKQVTLTDVAVVTLPTFSDNGWLGEVSEPTPSMNELLTLPHLQLISINCQQY